MTFCQLQPFRARLAVLAALAVLLLGAGCEREEGESCQDNRDCEQGLICSGNNAPRGVCIRPEDVKPDAAIPDAGNPPINEDDGGSVDAALPTSDTGTPDGGSDAGPGGSDSGSDDAGG